MWTCEEPFTVSERRLSVETEAAWGQRWPGSSRRSLQHLCLCDELGGGPSVGKGQKAWEARADEVAIRWQGK